MPSTRFVSTTRTISKNRVMGAIALSGIATLAACYTIPNPPVQQQAPKQAAVVEPARPVLDPVQVARGEYVSDLAGCKTCHSPMKAGVMDRAHPFAGGGEGKLPGGGVWRAPNISPDPQTGIGAWTDTQIITAIRRGVRPDGKRLAPLMPYPYYHSMTDADARAVVTYLRSQKGFYNKVARSELLAMQPVDLKEPTDNVDDTNDPKAHGQYIANLMHCGACHTPHEGPQANVAFAGGVILPLSDNQTVPSPNITSDPDTGIGQWSEGDIIAAVRTGKTPQGHDITGPMAMYIEGWSKLDEADAHALVAFIKSVPPANNPIPERQAIK
jgi:mono/diheme cytochrome c family protein